MPNYKHSKRRPRQRPNIDGIVVREGFKGRGSIDFNRQVNSKAQAGTMDDFNRPEGFTPGVQPVIDNTEIALNMPAETSRRPVAKRRGLLRRKNRQRKPWSRRRKIISSLAVILMLAGGFLGLRLYLNANKIFSGGGKAPGLSQCQDEDQLKKEGDCRINVLVLGIGGPGHDAPDLTDTILLASIDPVNNKIDLLSIPRDLWVQIPGYGYHKINEAYYDGKQYSKSTNNTTKKRDGLKLVDQSLEPILGVPIHFHVLVNFKAFKEAVNAIGGIMVDVPERLYDPSVAWENNYNPVIAEKGLQKFNGEKALLYAKSRKSDSDFARAERQRLIILALKTKILSLGTFSNPIKISNLPSSLGNNVFTDFSISDSTKLYDIVSKVPANQIKSLDLIKPPNDLLTTANLDGFSIVQPKAGLFNYGAIQAYVHGVLRDGQLAKENAGVAVYNGTTTAGLAANKASELKGLGYRIVKVGNAPKASDSVNTTIVDLSDGRGKYTRHYLELRFNVKAVDEMPDLGITLPEGVDFVIILGK